MPASNTIRGKAFEYACLSAIRSTLQGLGQTIAINTSSAYLTAENCYHSLSQAEQDALDAAAATAARMIFPLEPKLEYEPGTLLLAINADAAAIGPAGDVRDVLCVRRENDWEIGISCKHNHAALKHPRVTEDKNFGRDWMGYPCSTEFIQEITPVIEPLQEMRENDVLWSQVPDKMNAYYVPIINAYKDEIVRICAAHPDAPEKLLAYFFGSHDFYKVISNERRKTTTVEGFNMHGSLGKPSGRVRPVTRVSVLHMPSRLIEASIKPRSKTTIILVFDGGWTVSMRLHNKDKRVSPTSLAWDVQLVGLPTGTYVNTQSW